MKVLTFGILLMVISNNFWAQGFKKSDTIKVQDIEDVIIHKTGNPNKAKLFTSKSTLTIMENPQSVSIVTHEIIEQQQAKQLSDVLQNVNGLYVTSSRGNSQSNFGARGFIFGTENVFKNGARVNSGVFPEVSGLERIEVLKGANALMFGDVAAGGMVNMITKKPKFKFGGGAAFNTGSWDAFKPSIDFYGPLSNTIAFRTNAALEKTNSYRNLVKSEKYYVNPSLLFNIGKKSQLIVEGDYLKNNFTPDFGIGTLQSSDGTFSIPYQISRSAFFGVNWQYQNIQQASTDFIFNHQIKENWVLNVGASYQNYIKDYYSTERIIWSTDKNNRLFWKRPLNKFYDEQNYTSAQINLNGEMYTNKIKHKILIGTDADFSQTDRYLYNNPTVLNTVYLDDAATLESPKMPETEKTFRTRSPSNRFGIFAQDFISISPKINFLLGLRWSSIENLPSVKKSYLNFTENQTSVTTKFNAFSPKISMVYMPTENFSVFGNYTNSFSPNTGLDLNGNLLQPSVIDQFEVGLKKNIWKNSMAFNVTAYLINNQNTYQTSESNPNAKEYAGKMRSTGVELDLTGNPTPNLSLIGGFSYNHSFYTKTPDNFGYIENQRLVRTPAYTFNASIFYAFPNFLKNFKIGSSFYYIGNRLAGWNDTKTLVNQGKPTRIIKLKDYNTLDLSLSYQWKKFTIQGKINNIFDVLNYVVHENYSVNPIAPRNYYLTFSYFW